MRMRKVIFAVLSGILTIGMMAAFADAKPDKDPADVEPVIKGSIKVEGTPSDAELAKMAKISLADAEKIALKDVKGKADEKSINASELEVESGYLIYSIEVVVKGKPGFDELLIDAGNGKILAREHEDDGDPEEGGD